MMPIFILFSFIYILVTNGNVFVCFGGVLLYIRTVLYYADDTLEGVNKSEKKGILKHLLAWM